MIQQLELFFKNIMQNPVISTIIKIVLIYYACIIAPKLNPVLLVLFDNPMFKIVILLLIFYIANVNFTISLLLIISVVISIYTVNNIKLNDLLNIDNIDNTENIDSEDIINMEIEEEINKELE